MGITLVGKAMASGTGTAPSCTHGLTILTGDIVLVYVHVNNNQRVTSNNGGYTMVEDWDGQGGDSDGFAVYHRAAGASEPSAYSFTIGTSATWVVQIRVYRGVHADVWDVAPAAGGEDWGTGETGTAPSITALTAGALAIVWAMTDSATVTHSSPSNGYGDLLATTSSGPICTSSFTKTIAAAGATGDVDFTLSASNDWEGMHCALKPAALEEHSGSGSASGNGTVADAATKGGRGSASISVAGTIAALGLAAVLGVGSISGSGVSAAVGAKTAPAAIMVSAGGAVSASGNAGFAGGAVVSAAGQAVASGTKACGSEAADSEAGAPEATGFKGALVGAAVAGDGQVVAAGEAYEPAGPEAPSTVAGAGSVLSAGAKDGFGAHSLAQAGAAQAQGSRSAGEAVSASASGVTAAGSQKGILFGVAVQGAGSTAAYGEMAVGSGASISVPGAVAASDEKGARSSGLIASSGSVTAANGMAAAGAASLSSGGAVAADGGKSAALGSSVFATGALSSGSTKGGAGVGFVGGGAAAVGVGAKSAGAAALTLGGGSVVSAGVVPLSVFQAAAVSAAGAVAADWLRNSSTPVAVVGSGAVHADVLAVTWQIQRAPATRIPWHAPRFIGRPKTRINPEGERPRLISKKGAFTKISEDEQ